VPIINRIRHFISDQRKLFWLFWVLLLLPNVVMFFTESTTTLTRCINILLPAAVYGILLTLPRKPGKMMWWLFIFMLMGETQITLLYLFGESPIAVDMYLNMLTTNPGEVNELLSSLLIILAVAALIFVIYILGAALSCALAEELSKRLRRKWRLCFIVLLVISGALLGVNYKTNHKFRIANDIFPVNSTYNMLLGGDRMTRLLDYRRHSTFDYHATATHDPNQPEVYVLIIQETLRADNMSVYGYERKTTPVLDSLRNECAVFRDVLTMSNTTHKSVPLLLTSAAREDFDSIYTQSGLLKAFKEVGYRTAFYSNQHRNHSFIDLMGQQADETVFIADALGLGKSVDDDHLVDLFTGELGRYHGEKCLIVLHCYGSHYNYTDRYKGKKPIFTPDNVTEVNKRNRRQLVNAYDNTVYYTDRLIGDIIEQLQQLRVPAAMLMVSDHGEDIFDDQRERFLHSSPLPTYYQMRIPLIVWASTQYKQQYPDKWQQLINHQDIPISSNRVVFHTLLDLGGITMQKFSAADALSNDAFVPSPRLYVNDHNEYRPLDDCGLKNLDVNQFSLHHLQYP